MNLFELAESLPNGLHDAEVRSISVDYLQQTALFELEIWTGSMDSPPEEREEYRAGQIELSNLLYLSIDTPDSTYPQHIGDALTVDLSPPEDPSSANEFRLFVYEWNAFIRGSAPNARLKWIGEPFQRSG